jgi:hypothetical protein
MTDDIFNSILRYLPVLYFSTYIGAILLRTQCVI